MVLLYPVWRILRGGFRLSRKEGGQVLHCVLRGGLFRLLFTSADPLPDHLLPDYRLRGKHLLMFTPFFTDDTIDRCNTDQGLRLLLEKRFIVAAMRIGDGGADHREQR